MKALVRVTGLVRQDSLSPLNSREPSMIDIMKVENILPKGRSSLLRP